MTFTYEVSLAGRVYDAIPCGTIQSTITLKQRLVSEGHPADIDVRLRPSVTQQQHNRARHERRLARCFN